MMACSKWDSCYVRLCAEGSAALIVKIVKTLIVKIVKIVKTLSWSPLL